MKWSLVYSVGFLLLLAPAGLRLLLRSTAVAKPLEEAAVAAGKTLFTHEWTVNDPLCPNGDGLSPVFNATSCAQCHFQGGLGGSGGLEHNVTTFQRLFGRGLQIPEQGVLHAYATCAEYQENLTHADPQFPALVRPTLKQIQQTISERGRLVQISQRNTPALFGAKFIEGLPDHVILANERSQKLRWGEAGGQGLTAPVGRALLLPDGRVGKFGWKAQSSNLLAFVQAACANELGLGNPGQAQPVPLARAKYQPPGLDLTTEQCEQMTAFITALPRPVEKVPEGSRDNVARGRRTFQSIGCAECHVPNLGSLQGVYSDFLLHRMGGELEGGGSYNSPLPGSSPGNEPLPDEWRTPPLWGVADSAPYLHDGRAATLEEAIRMHGGQAGDATRRFQSLPGGQREDLIHFLKTLRAPG